MTAVVPLHPTPHPEPWPEPIDILGRPVTTGVASIAPDCVPRAICDLAISEARRLGTDPVGIAAAAIGVCSGVISDEFKIRLKYNDRGWRESPRLWVCLLAESGAKKSEQLKVAVRPVFALQAAMRDRHLQAAARHAEDLAHWKKHGKKAGEPEPEAPKMQRVICSDFTVEALSEILAGAARKMLVHADELAQFLGMFERYTSSAKMSAGRGHMLSAYEGGPHMIDRVQRGAVYIPNWSIALIGGTQPDRLRSSVTDLASDGLLQRFMMIRVPESSAQGEDDDLEQDQGALERYAEMIRGLHELRPHDLGEGRHPDIRGKEEDRARIHRARRSVFALAERLERDVTLPAGFRQAASKWRGTLARLAAVFHCIDVVETGATDRHHLRPETVEMAARFMLRIVLPATFAFHLEGDDSAESPVANARWIAGHILAHRLARITRRDVGRASLGLRGKSQAIMDAAEVLLDVGWLAVDPYSSSPAWDVNPQVHTLFAEAGEAERRRRLSKIAEIRESVPVLARRKLRELDAEP